MQKKFDDFNADLKANEVRLAEMNEIAMQLMSLGQTEAALKIQTQMEDLNRKWVSIQQLTAERAQQLGSAHEVQRFHRDVDETKVSRLGPNQRIDEEFVFDYKPKSGGIRARQLVLINLFH